MTLKIRRLTQGEFIVFVLSGRIEDENLAQLQELVSQETHRVTFDLKEVNLVGRDTVRFFAQHERNGGRLVDCPSYVRAWIARL